MDRPDQSSIPKPLKKVTYNTPVPSLPRLSPNTPDIIKYHVYIHRTCDLPVSSPLADHLGGILNPMYPHAMSHAKFS